MTDTSEGGVVTQPPAAATPYYSQDAATVVAPLEEAAAPEAVAPVAAPDAPLLPMTGRNGASSAPKTLLHRRRVRAARKKTIP